MELKQLEKALGKILATAKIIPIYKKGSRKELASYRPEALSHAKKAIEAAVLIEHSGEYKYSSAQLGFQLKTGPGTAISRHIANRKEVKYYIVLQQKPV